MNNEDIRDGRNRMHATGECPECGQVAFKHQPDVAKALDDGGWAAAPHKDGCPLRF